MNASPTSCRSRATSRAAELKSKERQATYLTSRRGGGRCGVREHMMGWHLLARMPIVGPVRARLRIEAARALLIAVRHVLGRRRGISRVLVMTVGRARSRNGRIYGHIAVRFDLLGLMVASILQRHGRRTCWCLRHTSAAAAGGACWMVLTETVFWIRTR